MKKIELAQILKNAERFTLSNGTDEISIKSEDISNDLLALANGYKEIGGAVYIVQTYDLRSIIFDCSERNETLWFMSWAVQYTD